MNGFVKAAVSIQIGVRKTPPVRSGRLTSDSGESPEQIALDELGAMDLMRRAGVRSVPTAPLPPAPSEGSRIAAAALPLAEALESSLPAALEWAAEAARRGFVAPPENLATLVSLSARYPAFLPVLGERGRWLADAMGVALPAHTPVGRPDQNAFDAMAWRERADALLEWGKPTPADETMLGRALEDRRKEVREAALDLLLKLDDSSPARAIRALATAAVEIRKSFLRTDLQVVPPDPRNLPAWLPRTTSRPGTGESGLALLDVVRRTPPSFWDRSVLDLIAWAEKTEYSEILTAAWEEAALRFEDNSWIDALYSRSTFSIPANAPLFAKNASDEALSARTSTSPDCATSSRARANGSVGSKD